MKARAANLNAALWTFYAFLSILCSWAIGSIIVTMILLLRDPVLRGMLTQQPPDKDGIMNYLKTQNLLLPEIFLLFCGVGGYLFIHYLISKKLRLSSNDTSGEM
jgi:hypothetical protein